VRVRSLIVQFRKWPSGVASMMNEIHVRVDAIGSYQSGDHHGEEHVWFEACERAASGGSDDPWRISIGQQGYGNGFRVTFPKLTGVALREVIALCDVRSERV